MKYYKTCPYCGSHLDTGEMCDCREIKPFIFSTVVSMKEKNGVIQGTARNEREEKTVQMLRGRLRAP